MRGTQNRTQVNIIPFVVLQSCESATKTYNNDNNNNNNHKSGRCTRDPFGEKKRKNGKNKQRERGQIRVEIKEWDKPSDRRRKGYRRFGMLSNAINHTNVRFKRIHG